MQEQLNLKEVVLIGRTFGEYARYFQCDAATLQGKLILDVASGVSSFGAEARALGLSVTGADPIYGMSADVLEAKCRSDLAEVARQLPSIMHKFRWDFYKNPEGLRAMREAAYTRFIADYARDARPYVRAALPVLPFPDRAFDLALVSFFLFMYAQFFDAGFHAQSLRELARVTGSEIRIYPLVDLKGERPSFFDETVAAAEALGFVAELKPAGLEFLINATHYLSLKRV